MLNKEDVYELFCQAGEETLREYQPHKNGRKFQITTTSGTTKKPPMAIIRPINKRNPAVSMQKRGNCLYALNTIQAQLSIVVAYIYDKDGTCLSLQPVDIDEHIETLLRDFEPKVLGGLKVFILNILEKISDNINTASIKEVILRESLWTNEERSFFLKKFPHATIVECYGIGEVGLIGRRCPSDYTRAIYHVVRDDVTLTVLHEDETRVGELAITTQISRSVSLQGYAPGDAARLVVINCSCDYGVSFELFGRIGHDYVKLTGALARVEEFDRVANELSLYVQDYRADVGEKFYEGKILGKIVLHIVPTKILDSQNNAKEFLEKEFERRLFLTPTRTLVQLVREGLFFPLEVQFTEHFPDTIKMTKLRQMKD